MGFECRRWGAMGEAIPGTPGTGLTTSGGDSSVVSGIPDVSGKDVLRCTGCGHASHATLCGIEGCWCAHVARTAGREFASTGEPSEQLHGIPVHDDTNSYGGSPYRPPDDVPRPLGIGDLIAIFDNEPTADTNDYDDNHVHTCACGERW